MKKHKNMSRKKINISVSFFISLSPSPSLCRQSFLRLFPTSFFLVFGFWLSMRRTLLVATQKTTNNDKYLNSKEMKEVMLTPINMDIGYGGLEEKLSVLVVFDGLCPQVKE